MEIQWPHEENFDINSNIYDSNLSPEELENTILELSKMQKDIDDGY
jgi:hypothetical protein